LLGVLVTLIAQAYLVLGPMCIWFAIDSTRSLNPSLWFHPEGAALAVLGRPITRWAMLGLAVSIAIAWDGAFREKRFKLHEQSMLGLHRGAVEKSFILAMRDRGMSDDSVHCIYKRH
jgi:hypothetical protein